MNSPTERQATLLFGSKMPSRSGATASRSTDISSAEVPLNGIVSHEDWMVTFASAAGKDDLKADILDGYEAIG
ncbi:MAG: hypothetical protein CMJ77_08250 [Planctomycetaceae bacterium]|nr:hypothetical protein [Planctomycetaceae bacterium]